MAKFVLRLNWEAQYQGIQGEGKGRKCKAAQDDAALSLVAQDVFQTGQGDPSTAQSRKRKKKDFICGLLPVSCLSLVTRFSPWRVNSSAVLSVLPVSCKQSPGKLDPGPHASFIQIGLGVRQVKNMQKPSVHPRLLAVAAEARGQVGEQTCETHKLSLVR